MSVPPPARPSAPSQPPASQSPWPNPAYAWWVVIVMFLCAIFSFLDRQILSLLVEEIKRDLALSEVQVGLIQGAPFAIFYSFMSIPIALAADRFNRRNIIAMGLSFWSLATAACGVAMGFWSLFMARIGVGSGEAALGPSAYSMISDYFPREKLAMALSVFAMGNLTGAGAAFMIGGTVGDYVAHLGNINLPLFGEIFSWQLTFFVVGLPGLALAAVVMSLREPVRRGLSQSGLEGSNGAALRDFARFFASHWVAFATLFASFTLLVLIAYANFAWIPTFLRRTFGWSVAEAGLVYGSIVLVFGTGGALFGGWLSSWLALRGHTDAPYRATLLCTLPLAPLAILTFVVADSGEAAMGWFVFWQFFGAVPAGLAGAAMMSITPNDMRAKVSSIYLFFSNLIGITIGAASVAFITQEIFANDMMVRYSLVIVNCIGAPLAVLVIWPGMRYFRQSVCEIEALSKQTATTP